MRLDRSLTAICGGEIEDHLIDLLCDVCEKQRAEIDEEQLRTTEGTPGTSRRNP